MLPETQGLVPKTLRGQKTLHFFDYSIENARKLREELKEKEISFEEYAQLEQGTAKGNLDLIKVEKVVVKGNRYFIGLFLDPYELYDNPSMIDLIEVTSHRCDYLNSTFPPS